MLRRKLPVSRKPLALTVLLCLGGWVLVFSVAVRLPRWLEAEIILGIWWGTWVWILSWMLYQGHQVDDDAEVGFGGDFSRKAGETAVSSLDLGCLVFGEGCLIAIGLVILIFLLALFIEFALPALGFILFLSVGGMFARAINDTHGCERNLGRSLLWGGLWATLYVGPLLAVVPWLPLVFPKFG
ncbi:MAG: hypothetical protein ABL962_00070 [Fimbriimonadaceae bacterium]